MLLLRDSGLSMLGGSCHAQHCHPSGQSFRILIILTWTMAAGNPGRTRKSLMVTRPFRWNTIPLEQSMPESVKIPLEAPPSCLKRPGCFDQRSKVPSSLDHLRPMFYLLVYRALLIGQSLFTFGAPTLTRPTTRRPAQPTIHSTSGSLLIRTITRSSTLTAVEEVEFTVTKSDDAPCRRFQQRH